MYLVNRYLQNRVVHAARCSPPLRLEKCQVGQCLEFLESEELGFWERNGYNRRGEPWAEERYSSF